LLLSISRRKFYINWRLSYSLVWRFVAITKYLLRSTYRTGSS